MRYLTKIADQIVALISEEDALKIVWRQERDEDLEDQDEDESDRMFTFEVAKTYEQEEAVTTHSGFTFEVPAGSFQESKQAHSVDPTKFRPSLIPGETEQGVLEVEYVEESTEQRPLSENYSAFQLRDAILKNSIRLSDDLTVNALDILINQGLTQRAPRACEAYQRQVDNYRQRANEDIQNQEKEMLRKLEAEASYLSHSANELVLSCVLKQYPSIDRAQLRILDMTSDTVDDEAPKPDDHFRDLIALYPGIRDVLRTAQDPKAYQIQKKSYKINKERILILDRVLRDCADLSIEKQEELISSILDMGPTRSAADLLSGIRSKTRWVPNLIVDFFSGANSSVQRLSDAQRTSSSIDDAKFLASLSEIVNHTALLTDAVNKVKEEALEFFGSAIQRQAKTLVAKIRQIQEEECKRQIKREVEAQKDNTIDVFRRELLNALSNQLLLPGVNHTVFIDHVEKRSFRMWDESFQVIGRHEIRSDAHLKYTIQPLYLTSDDKQGMQLDASYVPTPRLHRNSASSFQLPHEQQIL